MVGIVHCHLSFRGCGGNKGVQFVSSSKWSNDGRFWLQYQCEALMKLGVELSADLKEKTRHFQSSRNKHSGQIPSKNTISRWMFHSFEIISSFPKFFFRQRPFHFFKIQLSNPPQKTGTNNNRPGSDTRGIWPNGTNNRHQLKGASCLGPTRIRHDLPSLKLTVHPWELMVGRWSFPFGFLPIFMGFGC